MGATSILHSIFPLDPHQGGEQLGTLQISARPVEKQGDFMCPSRRLVTLADAKEIDEHWVLQPMMDSTDMRTAVACLFGDAVARTLGSTHCGLGNSREEEVDSRQRDTGRAEFQDLAAQRHSWTIAAAARHSTEDRI